MVDNNIPNPGQSPPPGGPPGGTAPQAPPPAQYGQYQQTPAPTYPAPPRSGFLEGLVKPDRLATLIFVGMILVVLGMIMLSSTNFLDITDDDYRDNVGTLTGLGWIVADLGMFVVSSLLIIAGLIQKGSDRYMKMAMMIAGGLVLIAWFGSFI